MGIPDRNTRPKNKNINDGNKRSNKMSDTLRVDVLTSGGGMSFDDIICLAKGLERELNKANAIIAAALAYVEEFKEFFPEETLIAILEGRMTAVDKKEEC
jgi:hypothetical protein